MIAIKDVQDNIPETNMVILPGDIIHRGRDAEQVYNWFLKVEKKSTIPYWYSIAGNHDCYNLKAYLKYINNYLHYSVNLGNILFIFMSDTSRKPYTVIPDDVFDWWKSLVVNNQDKIIVTVTHAALNESAHFASNFPSMRIKGSRRFAGVLKKYRVDLWISGHSHLSQSFKRKWTVPETFDKRTLFVEVSSIRKDFFSAVESYVIVFNKNSDRVILLPRNHEEQKFISEKIIQHRLGHRFQWNNAPPVLNIFK